MNTNMTVEAEHRARTRVKVHFTLTHPDDVKVLGHNLAVRRGWIPAERIGTLRFCDGQPYFEDLTGLEMLEKFKFSRTWTDAEWEAGEWDAELEVDEFWEYTEGGRR